MSQMQDKIDALTIQQLRNIVVNLVNFCFLEEYVDGDPEWSTEEEIDGGDLVEYLMEVLDANGLIPEDGPVK